MAMGGVICRLGGGGAGISTVFWGERCHGYKYVSHRRWNPWRKTQKNLVCDVHSTGVVVANMCLSSPLVVKEKGGESYTFALRVS